MAMPSRMLPDAIYILVMHKGEEPGAETGTPLPEILLRNSADEGVLDEIVSQPGTGRGSTHEHSAAGAGFLSRSRPKSFTLPAHVLAKCQLGVAPERRTQP
jgi:hypothetical protein